MKRVVLQLSWRFPQTHSRKGELTHFREKLRNAINGTEYTVSDRNTAKIKGRKIHTIRLNFERWKHNIGKIADGGFALSVRQWKGSPYKSKQDEMFLLRENVGYQRISLSYDPDTDKVRAVIDGKGMADVEQIANNDGLSLKDFKEWFFGENPKEKKLITGVVIHFTDFRY